MTGLTTEDRDAARVRRVLDLIGESAPSGPLHVLDLACRTGVFVSALAGEGMQVTGVEGREDNTRHITPHPNATILCADVRDLTSVAPGPFDVTLCLGILYHLTAPDSVRLLQDVAAVTDGLVIVDTHVSPFEMNSATVDGITYSGAFYDEGDASTPWSSIGNLTSWWFTESSLRQAMTAAGLTDITAIDGRAYADEPDNRQWFTARSTP